MFNTHQTASHSAAGVAIADGNVRPPLVVLVNADARALRHTEAMLSADGYRVAASTSFVVAKQLLDSLKPDLVIADIRLDELNGLQLAIASRRDHPGVPVILTRIGEDTVAEVEAKQ